MKNGLIFDTEIEAMNWDEANNSLTGSITRHKYERKMLTTTTELTKAEYAKLLQIPQQLEDEEGVSYDNPKYTALPTTVTVRKYALMVGDDLNTYTEEDGVIVPDNVVDVTDLLYVSEGL